MKVYVLTISSGQYEDHRESIVEVHTDPLKAEERKRYIEADYKSQFDNPPPEPTVPDDDNDDLWHRWFLDKCDVEEFNCCYIRETELIN